MEPFLVLFFKLNLLLLLLLLICLLILYISTYYSTSKNQNYASTFGLVLLLLLSDLDHIIRTH